MSKELSKEDLRRPDEFVGFFESKIYQFENRKKQIFWALIAVVVALGVVFFMQSQNASASRAASDDFEKTMEKLPQSFSKEGGDWEGFLTSMDEFLKAHPNTSFTPSANLYKAKAQFSLKKFDDALVSYQMAEKKMKAPYSYLAQEGEAITHMQLAHWEQAKTILTALSTKQDNPLRDFHLFNLALVQEEMGNHDQAMASYKKIVDEFPTSQYAETAKIKNPEAAKK